MISLLLLSILAFLLSFLPAYAILPGFIRRMKAAGNVGTDVNKKGKPLVAESGGMVAVMSFSIAMFTIAGIASLSNIEEQIVLPLQAASSVFIAASIIGFIDDYGLVTRRQKAALITFAGLPLIFLRPVASVIELPFVTLNFTNYQLLGIHVAFILFWLVIVPFGVMASANAFNMAAGYNGLESGIPIIASAAMVIVLLIKGHDAGSAVIFMGLVGSALALYLFNRYPAKVFVGDVGTLGFGATYATAAILGNVAFYAVIAILPMFFEFFATFYYTSKGKERRTACHNPVFLPEKKLKPPKGCGTYTLAYYLLNRKPMTEPQLVRTIHSMYVLCGIAAILLAFLP